MKPEELKNVLAKHKLCLDTDGREGEIANLYRADLQGADLSGAQLRYANLAEAGLEGANLKDARLWGTIGNMKEIKSLQLDKYPVTYTADRLQIGFRNHSIEEWRGFSDDDIKFKKLNFKQTFLNLSFYDTDNPMTQQLVTTQTIFSQLKPSDLLPFNTIVGLPGQPKPANQIPLTFVLENPLTNQRGFLEGYYLYDYRDILKVGEFKYLYMKASFKNAKDGKSTNLMVKPNAQPIDILIREVYTRYKLFRTQTGYYYQIDDTYQGNGPSTQNNVTYTQNPSSVSINLFKIQAL